MNISISCLHKTDIRRYRKKVIQELNSIKHLDDSISFVDLSFSIISDKPETVSPIKCRISAHTPKVDVEIIHYANSEIRAFNLCFEELLYLLLEYRKPDLNKVSLRKHFSYLSVSPEFGDKSANLKEESV